MLNNKLTHTHTHIHTHSHTHPDTLNTHEKALNNLITNTL